MTSDFDLWIKEAYAARGAFTLLVILLKQEETTASPLASTYMNVIGDEMDWSDMALLLTGSGMPWDCVALFAEQDGGEPLDNVQAQRRLRDMEKAVIEDRMTINQGDFFDAQGRRLRLEPILDS